MDDAELASLLVLSDEAIARASESVRDGTGLLAHQDVASSPLLLTLTQRVAEAVGWQDVLPETVRFRRYEVGEGHPPHGDHYELGDAALVMTAMLVLHAPELGGATEFPDASPYPVSVAPHARQLVTWTNVDAEGEDDPHGTHRGVSVLAGRKDVLLWFFYQPRLSWSPPDAPRTVAHPEPGTLLTCIDDGVPEETVRLLAEACSARDVLFRVVDPRTFRYRPQDRLPAGSMLFRPSGSRAAQNVEEFLLHDDVASFYPDTDAALFSCGAPRRQLERVGLTVPRTIPVASSDPTLLAELVERLGGFPVIVKVGGGEGGVGVMRADNLPVLGALLDYLVRAQGAAPELSAYVPEAMHHRVIVVGNRAVATYRNPLRQGDFRSTPSDDPADYSADVPEGLANLAIAAVEALRLRFGGVDILRHPSGRLYVLEVNFPCYFAQATLGGSIDVAGPMLDELISAARSLVPRT